jgi:hypothetical protein
MSATPWLRPPIAALRCDHCGRAVCGTRHTRTTYEVDYFRLHGGRGERCWVTGDDGRSAAYIRLLDQFDLITCVQCYRRSEVQDARERRFHDDVEVESA